MHHIRRFAGVGHTLGGQAAFTHGAASEHPACGRTGWPQNSRSWRPRDGKRGPVRAAAISRGTLLNLLKGKNPDRVEVCTA